MGLHDTYLIVRVGVRWAWHGILETIQRLNQ